MTFFRLDRILPLAEVNNLQGLFQYWKAGPIRLVVRATNISEDAGVDYNTTGIIECRMRPCYEFQEQGLDPSSGSYWWERPNVKRGRILGKDQFTYKLYPRIPSYDIVDAGGTVSIRPVKPKWLSLADGWDTPLMGLAWQINGIFPYQSIILEYEVSLMFKGQR